MPMPLSLAPVNGLHHYPTSGILQMENKLWALT